MTFQASATCLREAAFHKGRCAESQQLRLSPSEMMKETYALRCVVALRRDIRGPGRRPFIAIYAFPDVEGSA